MKYLIMSLLMLLPQCVEALFDGAEVEGPLAPVVHIVLNIYAIPAVTRIVKFATRDTERQSVRFQKSSLQPIAGIRVSNRFIFLEASGSAVRYIKKLPEKNKDQAFWVPTGYLGFGYKSLSGDGGVLCGVEINQYSTRPFVGASLRLF